MLCSALESVKLPESLTHIDSWTFCGCTSLESVEIPANVSRIDVNPFPECRTKITVSPENKHFKVIDGNLYSIDGAKLISYIPKENETHFSVPEGVTVIGHTAFCHCDNLESVSLPEGVTTLGAYAFQCCKSLKRIALPSTLTIIECSAFDYCEKLESIHIPKSVATIEWCAFNRCEKLENVYYGGSKSDWKSIKIDRKLNEKLNGKKSERAALHYECK
jgi:hypothetical protein